MITEILSIFDQPLSDKCWIDNYGRLAIPGKQKIGDKWKRFPLSTQAITSECEDLTPYLNTLVPDDTKKGVAFWRALTPLITNKIPGISANRKLKKAEITLQFVCWLNIRKASGVNNSSNWASVIDGIVKDAWKTIDCRNQNLPTGITGVSNLTIEAVSVGEIESWRKAMSEFTIDNLEALTVWPFAGFTITCKVSFITKADCFEAFDCSTEFDATGFCPPSPDMAITITRNASAGEIEGYPNYFPLSMLPDEFWNETDGVVTVTDQHGHEIPCQVVGLDIGAKTGSLLFKASKTTSASKYQIHYNAGQTAHAPGDQLGSINVWTAFDDVILHDAAVTDFMIKNHKYAYRAGLVNGFDMGLANGLMEMKVPEFGDGVFSGITHVDWAQEFGAFDSPKTFLFAFKMLNQPAPESNIFNNYYNGIDGIYKFDVLYSGGQYTFRFVSNMDGSFVNHDTAAGQLTDIATGQWIVVALKYEAGTGEVELDVNGVARTLTIANGTYPAQTTVETVNYQGRSGLLESGGGNLMGYINPVWIYDGALLKAQRDVFYRNWSNPGGFWTV